MIEVKNLSKSYGDNNILNNINFSIKEGEFISIIGESGCGKTTLLNCLSGIVTGFSGEILFNGKNIALFNDEEISSYRLNDIGYIFQENNLIDCLNVEENIKLPLLINKKKVSSVSELLKLVGLDGYEKRKISTLSGGQKQRIAIARALINNPKIIFADEPTSSLNTAISNEIKEVFRNIIKEKNTTIVMVTHSERMAIDTRILKVEDGIIVNEI